MTAPPDPSRDAEEHLRPTSLPRRLAGALVLLVVVVVVPVAVVTVLLDGEAAGDVALGALFGLLLAVRAGWRTALATAPLLGVAVAASGAVVGTWWWVALLGLLAAVTGAATVRAAHVPVALVAVAAAVAPARPDGDLLTLHALLVGTGALHAALVARRLGLPRHLDGPRLPSRPAAATALVLATVVVVAAAVALLQGERFSYWLPMTALLLVLPVPGLRLHRQAGQRVVGTLLGVLAAAALAVLGLPEPLRLVLALVVLLLALVVTRPLWANALLGTLVVVLVLDPSGAGLAAAGLRLEATVVAALLVLAGAALLSWWGGGRAARRVPRAGVDARAVAVAGLGLGHESDDRRG